MLITSFFLICVIILDSSCYHIPDSNSSNKRDSEKNADGSAIFTEIERFNETIELSVFQEDVQKKVIVLEESNQKLEFELKEIRDQMEISKNNNYYTRRIHIVIGIIGQIFNYYGF